MDWKDTRVTVMGLGLNNGGLGVVRYLLDKGASVIITDLKSREILQPTLDQLGKHPRSSAVQCVLGMHRDKDFTTVDAVIKNPAVPNTSEYLQRAREAQVPVYSDLEVFFKEHAEHDTPPPIIGITGTRGKSTTSSLIAHILERAGKRVALAGNVGKSVLDLVVEFDQLDVIVLELSSFQLAGLEYSPQYAVITNMYPDHLDRYPNMQEYIADKQRIYQFQQISDYSFFWIDQIEYGGMFSQDAQSHVITISADESVEADFTLNANGIQGKSQQKLSLDSIKLKGNHNDLNALMAVAVCCTFETRIDSIQEGLNSFVGVEGRQQCIGTIRGVEIINDTTSTMPIALMCALDTFDDRPLHLICGGENKNLSYDELTYHAFSFVKSMVLLPGGASELMNQAMLHHSTPPNIFHASSLEEAFTIALKESSAGERILFSPGATSFGQFQNEFHRGAEFERIVQSYAEYEE